MPEVTLPRWVYDAGEDTAYELLEEIRRGGEGRMFRARQVGAADVERSVALKILTPEDHFGGFGDPAAILRLWREQVQVMRNFAHAGFASVHVAFPLADLPGTQRNTPAPWVGLPAFVMAWIEGSSLEAWRTPERRSYENLLVLGPCAEGLDAFHRATGHVHRDLKPANVIVADDGARVIDYGLVRSVEQLRSQSHLIGTAGYIAPELYRGAQYTPATDLYAFAGIAFFQLTGKAPAYGQQAGYVRKGLNDAGCHRAGPLLAAALSPFETSRGGFSGAGDLLAQLLGTIERPGQRPARPRPPALAPAPTVRQFTPRLSRLMPKTPVLRALAMALALCTLTVIMLLLTNH